MNLSNRSRFTNGYDSLDRLLSYSATPAAQSFTYDANGNRLTRVTEGGSSTYTYATSPASNRLISVSGQQVRSNSHDLNGSVTGDGVNTFAYDARGRMESHTVTAITTSYGINGLQQRVSKAGIGVLPNGAMQYAYDEAGHLIGEYDGTTGAAVQETVWLGDVPVAVLTGSGVGAAAHYIHADHLNAPKVITDQIGNTVWNWDHDPFGNGQPSGTFTYNLRFPGQYYDMESGLSYNLNRDYDPALGRYVESDPIGLEGGINTYGYVGQNPLWATDPTGEIGIVGATVGAGIELAIQGYNNYKNGCDVTDIDNYDWSDVGVSAAVGALSPGLLSVGKTGWTSSKAIKVLSGQLERAQTVNRAAKIERRILSHQNQIVDALIVLGAFQGAKAFGKAADGDGGCSCSR